ncbi:hypothetical protein SteCoe_31330 [Stentor coeruleus]|uniref:EF-hand domain-containing protein n=1 Tax=Stentor coeruleus TaxID=5963 RepID=A0A1R2B202_9CILI|nr:hypothetical protein SteCoe_31330 [Stentor coeruleus]
MGNLLQPSPSNYLQSDVHSNLLPLTKWTPADILKVQQRIAKIEIHRSSFVDKDQIKILFKNTPISGRESLIVLHFTYKTCQKVDIMEVMAGLITYASCTWQEKVKLALDIFDFDENYVITYDEMVVMCKSFLNGVGIMTQSSLFSKSNLEAFADQAFIMADATPDGQVTYQELLEWIENNQVLSNLFKNNQPEANNPKKRQSIIEKMGFEITNSGNYPFSEGQRQTARHRTEPRKAAYKKPEETDEIMLEISDIFKKRANFRGKMIARELYDSISHNELLYSSRERILSELNFRLTSEVTFEEVKSCLDKSKSQASLFNKQPKATPSFTITNMSTLKALFSKYDLNHDGLLSLQELKKGLRDNFSIETIEEMFKEYDSDGNGMLDFEEFVRLFSPDGATIPSSS